jgi:L-lysine 6-transaminase
MTSISPQNVQQILQKHLIADGFDLTFDLEKSKGVYIYDSKYDRKLLDFFTCFASVPLGYNHPAMLEDEAFKKDLMLAALTNPSNSDIFTTQLAHFVNTFSNFGIPDYLPHAFFVAGGAPAIENALKTAMDWKVQKNFEKGYTTEKGFKVLHFEHAFHGRLGYTLSLTNTSPAKTKWFAKFDWPRVSHPAVKYPLTEENLADVIRREEISINQIKQAFQDNPDEICAIIIEPVQAEGGDNHVRQEYLEQLRILVDENEALLIYDEVQTGVGLTGKFWCHEHYGEEARPDILVFGKKMQVCGLLAGTKVDEIEGNVFNVPSRINSTWGGNLVDMVRITKVLEIMQKDNLIEHVASVGQYLQQQLSNLSEEFSIMSNIRGKGLLTAFDFPDQETRDLFIEKGIEKQAMFLGCADRTIRFRPALTMQKHDIDQGIDIMQGILRQF